jgi:type VI secretion system protein ImpH
MRNTLNNLAQLEEQASAYDFYAALRQIECATPQLPRIGHSLRPQDDAVRFGQAISMAFTPAMIASFKSEKNGQRTMLLNFFGLGGVNGPLPLSMTEFVRERALHHEDPTLSSFLNLFHHRLISLFYRAWASAQPVVSFDRPKEDHFARYIGSFIGIGEASLTQRDAVADSAKRYYAGSLSSHRRSAAGLMAILRDYLQLPVTLKQFIGHWMALPEDGRCYLHSGSGAPVLGMNTVMGSKVWNCQHRFRIVIGPLDDAQFQQLLPGGGTATRLLAWVRQYVGLTMDWDLNLILKKDQVPPCILGKNIQLGWTSWLRSRTPQQDDSQLIFSLNPAST